MRKKIDLKLEYLLILFCMFPFCGFNFGTDVQPFALLLAIMILMKKRTVCVHNKTWIYLTIGIVLSLTALSLVFVPPMDVLKRLFSYASIIIIPISIYNSGLEINGDKFEKIVKLAMLIWFFVGIVQRFVSRDFLRILVPLSRTSANRGVFSLASEPSFYGYMCFFFLLFALDFKKDRLLFLAIQIIQVVLLAQASVAIIYCAVFFGLSCLHMIRKMSGRNIVKLIGVLGLSLIAIYLIMTRYADTRMGYLIANIISGNRSLVTDDQSVFERFSAIQFSFSRAGCPGLIGKQTIMSGFGGVFYELGIFSVVLFVPILKSVFRGNDEEMRWVILISLTISMISAIQLSAPVFAMYIGYCELKHMDKCLISNDPESNNEKRSDFLE